MVAPARVYLLVIAAYCFATIADVQGQSGTIIPLYSWPGETNGAFYWQSLINARNANPQVEVWAIVNVANGPGSTQVPQYVSGIRKLQDNGINVMGYVHTSYGARPSADVKADIYKWFELYPDGITGIFFDEMAPENKGNELSYYSDLNAFAKSITGMKFTVGNPGSDINENMVTAMDTIIIFEDRTGFPGEAQYRGWHQNYSPSKWSIIPYNIPSLNAGQIQNAKQYVKYIYVTDDDLPNPWDTLPRYLNDLLNELK